MPNSRTIRFLVVAAALCVAASCARRPPAAVPSAPAGPTLVDVQLLAFNDFHGTLDPAAGSNGRVGTTPAGGVEYFAAELARLRATNPNTLVVSAGDNIGASTLLSGMFHDEPAIEALNLTGLQISTVGNHELDEGWAELYRMQTGGCHPVDGCQDHTPFDGARFEYLSANVALDPARVDPQALERSGWKPRGRGPQTLFPASTVRTIGGVKIGVIGLILHGAAEIVSPGGIRGLTFRREIDAGNEAVAALKRQGVRAIVVLIHEGGIPATSDPNGCGVTGPIVDIANGLSDDVDVVVSGHTHRAYVCTIGTKLVTSALSLGRIVTDIDLTIDRRTDDVVRKHAENVIVTHDLTKVPAETALLDHYRPLYTPLATRQVGSVMAPLSRAANAAGESTLGDVVSDAMLEAAKSVDPGVVAAITNDGGLRGDISGAEPAAPGAPRAVQYVNVFDTLPFGNIVMVKTVSGDTLLRWLEQQFDNPRAPEDKVMQVSGLTYSYTRSQPPGQRIDRDSVRIGERPLVPSERYRVASVDFVWNGGDGFSAATEGTDPVAVGIDVDAVVAYFGKHPALAPGLLVRVTRK